jgi:NADH dehydrogenase FAD-containing subunit
VTKILIVGDGLAAVKAAQILGRDNRFEVTLLSQQDRLVSRLLVQPSASSHLVFAEDIADLLQESGAKVQYGEIAKAFSKSAPKFEFDNIIQTHNRYPLQSWDQVQALQVDLHRQLLESEVRLTIVGAGVEGVELAAGISSYLRMVGHRHGLKNDFEIELVEKAPRILPKFSERFARKVHARLENLGVKITSSTKARQPAKQASVQQIWTPTRLTTGRLPINIIQAGPGNSAGLAAIYEGQYAANVLKNKLVGKPAPKRRPPFSVEAVYLGPRWSAVNFPGIQFFGLTGWLVHRWIVLTEARQLLPLRRLTRFVFKGTEFSQACDICALRTAPPTSTLGLE